MATYRKKNRRDPFIVMRDGQAQRQLEDGTVNVLDFDRYAVPLAENFQEPDTFYLKASDRDLHDLFYPDLTAHFDQRSAASTRLRE